VSPCRAAPLFKKAYTTVETNNFDDRRKAYATIETGNFDDQRKAPKAAIAEASKAKPK
jgi:hypothetical protein